MQNKYFYSLPVHLKDLVRIDRTASPAHIGRLKNAIDFEFVPEDGDFSVTGKEILAAADGIVFAIKDDSDEGGPDEKFMDKGNWVEISHENGEHSFYEHFMFKGIFVKTGDKVKRGHALGVNGITGFTFSSHLHFEVRRYKGNPDDDNFRTIKVRFREISE